MVVCSWFQGEFQLWTRAMEKAIQPLVAGEETAGPSGAKAHSLPHPSASTTLPEPSSAKKDKEKKFSRFAKKKWKEIGKLREDVA